MKIHYIQHDKKVTLSSIEKWAQYHGHSLSGTHVYEQQTFPATIDFDLLIILGGRMGAHETEQYAWLQDEFAFIRAAIDADKLVFGICLGAQILATVLGGKAYPHRVKEIGWWPVTFAPAVKGTLLQGVNEEEIVFQYHGDTFDLPAEATLLASNETCTNQAFCYGKNVLAVQFHPEVILPNLTTLTARIDWDKEAGPFVQTAHHFLQQDVYFKQSERIMFTLLNNFERAFLQQVVS